MHPPISPGQLLPPGPAEKRLRDVQSYHARTRTQVWIKPSPSPPQQPPRDASLPPRLLPPSTHLLGSSSNGRLLVGLQHGKHLVHVVHPLVQRMVVANAGGLSLAAVLCTRGIARVRGDGSNREADRSLSSLAAVLCNRETARVRGDEMNREADRSPVPRRRRDLRSAEDSNSPSSSSLSPRAAGAAAAAAAPPGAGAAAPARIACNAPSATPARAAADGSGGTRCHPHPDRHLPCHCRRPRSRPDHHLPCRCCHRPQLYRVLAPRGGRVRPPGRADSPTARGSGRRGECLNGRRGHQTGLSTSKRDWT